MIGQSSTTSQIDTARMACKSVKIGLYFKFLFSEEDTLVFENLIQDYDAFKYKYVPNLVSAKGYWIGMNTYTYKYAAEIMGYASGPNILQHSPL